MNWRLRASCKFAAVAVVLMAATDALADPPTPRKIVAVLDGNQTIGNSTTRRAVSFYDVTDLNGSPLNQTPLFSVWTGYEVSNDENFEEVSGLAINPINGTAYVSAFDSGPVGVADGVGDTQGDYDLYKIDYQSILKDFTDNGRAAGTMYAPRTAADGGFEVDHPDHLGTTVFLDNGIGKIGEVARTQGVPFFDPDLEFVNPATLLMLDDEEVGADSSFTDHQLRIINRTSTAQGAAGTSVLDLDPGAGVVNTTNGGYNSASNSQSWESNFAGLIDMDNGTGRSEPEDMAFVTRDGVSGVWVGESDGGGDDISFFEIDFGSNTATKKELRVGSSPYPQGFALDEDPTIDASTNDGDHDFVLIDADGNLVIGESGFFESPREEPKIIGREIVNYDGADTDSNSQNEVVPGGWSVSANLPVPTNDDDSDVTDGRFVTMDRGTGEIFYVDIDSSGPAVVSDLYVFDPVTGTMTYQEEDAIQGFVLEHGIRLFLRGDTNGDGVIDAEDLDIFAAAINDPTLGGTIAGVLGQEWYDLTGDSLLTGAPNLGGDMDELVLNVLGTAYGDANLDGMVNISDFLALQNNFGNSGGWAGGDFNGSGNVNISDFLLLQNSFGFSNMSVPSAFGLEAEFDSVPLHVTAVPEPSSFVLLGLGAAALAFWHRRKKA